MDFMRNNIFKLLTFFAAILTYFGFITGENNKTISKLFIGLIAISFFPLLLELKGVKININVEWILKVLTKATYFLFGSMFLLFALYLTSIFAGKISVSLNGIYGIDQKAWLGFMGTCLASLMGVASGYLGAIVREKYKK